MQRNAAVQMVIEILWEGPYTVEGVRDNANGPADYGLYQIYGTHNVLGPNTLLYIGKSRDRPFATRLQEHLNNWIRWEPSRTEIYLGRLGGADRMTEDRQQEWNEQIDVAERVLIYYSTPPYNSGGIGVFRENPQALILNFGQRHRLPPEFSTLWQYSSWTAGQWQAYGT